MENKWKDVIYKPKYVTFCITIMWHIKCFGQQWAVHTSHLDIASGDSLASSYEIFPVKIYCQWINNLKTYKW